MSSEEKSGSVNTWFIPAILLAVFLVNTVGVFLSVVLIDVSKTFQVSVGTVSQLATVTRFCGLAIGVAMGVLTLRYKMKSLFLIGIGLYGLGAIGSSMVTDFNSMLLCMTLLGIGGPIVGVLVYSMVGTHLPLKKRGWIIGTIWSMIFITNVIVAPITGIMTSLAGWRSVLSLFIFPLSIIILIIAYFALPSKRSREVGSTLTSTKGQAEDANENIAPPNHNKASANTAKAFKLILSNRSAIACMSATMLVSIMALTPFYAVSFFRTEFSVSVATASYFSSVVAVTGIFGALIAGRLVNRVGRKALIIISGFLSGAANIIFTFIPDIWGSLVFWGIAAFAVSMTWPALYALVVEQVPSYRSSMVSLNQSFRYIGAIIGLTLSGLILNTFSNNYQFLMVFLGSANIILAVVILLAAKDPCRNTNSSITSGF